jgi:hypothetical protein
MIRRANLNEILAQCHATLAERLLDRLDAAIISGGGAIWRAFVDGLVAYAYAEGVPPIDPPSDRVDEHNVLASRRCFPGSIANATNGSSFRRADVGHCLHDELEGTSTV